MRKTDLCLTCSVTPEAFLYAMRGGAKVVHSVDSSARAIALTNKNVELISPNDPRHGLIPKMPSNIWKKWAAITT